MADPEFTVEPFNFEQERWESYARYIERLRNQVAVRYSHNRPVTPIEVNPPTRFFDIVLRTNSSSVRIRIRRDNLYLVGYQMEGSDQWLELRYDNNNVVHRVTGSAFLSFGDRYDELVSAAGGVNATLSSIQVGRQQLIHAINTLATSPNDVERANSLLVVSFMISESARFRPITEYFVTQGTAGGSIPVWVQNYVRGWTDLSFPLLHADADNSFRLPENNRFNVFTFEAAAAIIGLLKGRFFGSHLHKRAADDDDDDEYPQGRPLLEVFSVTIDNINGNSNIYGEINGTIQVNDGLGYEYVYNIDSNHSQLIRVGENVVLNGPDRCISAYDSFTIDVTLMSKEGLSEDSEISKGQISWDITNVCTNVYDKLLFQQIPGTFGAATMAYAVLSDAVEAKVEITLIKNGEPASVYGLLTSHNVSLNSESVLFEKTRNRFINVNPGNLIPLSRLVVAVPLDSTFIVRADLKGANIFSSEDVIALGTTTFSPRLSGISEQNINGTNGNYIRVKVSWSWYV